MTTDPSVLTQVQAGVAWITLNRGPQRNALDIPTLNHLHALLDGFNRDPAVRVVVLTGSGRSFCAGADLAEWADAEARGALETYGGTRTRSRPAIALHAPEAILRSNDFQALALIEPSRRVGLENGQP